MLKIYKDLFSELNKKDLGYCHFKSNDHLDAGLNGYTDLDIVVSRHDSLDFTKTLLEFGFKRTDAGFGVRNHSREGYLGFDSETGRLVYIDLHFTIVIGKNRIREYSLTQFSKEIIENRILDQESSVFIASPSHEFLLLLFRASIKVRFRDRLKELYGRKFFDEDWQSQHNWLAQRSDIENIHKLLIDKFQQDAHILINFFRSYPSMNDLFYFKRIYKKKFLGSLKYGGLLSTFGMFVKEVNGFMCFINRRFLSHSLPMNRRYLSKGGIFIAFIGVDGAGKSTQIKNILEFLSWKLDVSQVYLGAGDGRSSWHRAILIRLRRLIEKDSKPSKSFRKKTGQEEKLSVKKFAKIIWAISLMIEKNSKLKKYHRQSKRGVVVVSDRYPQNNVKNFNDGPLLSKFININNKFSLLRWIAKKEEIIYSSKKYPPPDLVIKLVVDPEVSIQRGQSTSVDYLNKRIDAVNAIEFPKPCKIIEVDASLSTEDVFKEISTVIWTNL